MYRIIRWPIMFWTISSVALLFAQSDPGVRSGPSNAGQPLAGLTANELSFFQTSATPRFLASPSASFGTGPRFNGTGCAGCHAFPAPGGSSPANNPEVAMAVEKGATNTLPWFVTPAGPAIEARFINDSQGQPDGGVHNLFTITGRSDAPAGCVLQQEDFSNKSNLALRITTPTFGLGLVEAINETTLKNNFAANASLKQQFNISGHFNNSGNDGTITRFGWKAQNKSILMFAGEAYNAEMGVTSELFPNNRDETPACIAKGSPESATNFENNAAAAHIVSFMAFMKFLDQPTPACGASPLPSCSPSVQHGQQLFSSTGCALCHTPSLPTGGSTTAALSNKVANLYSDLAVHYMGSSFEDGIVQGSAQSGEFRTAPLWGLGQRIFFLHDGRTSDLLQAILAHSGDPADSCAPGCDQQDKSKTKNKNKSDPEGLQSAQAFKSLSNSDKQDLLNFLRSL